MPASGCATYLKEKFLKHAVGIAAWTMPTSITSRGHSADPGADGTANVIASFPGLAPSFFPIVNPWVVAIGESDFAAWGMTSWPYSYWSWADQSGNVLFVSRIADMSSATVWNSVGSDIDDGITGFEYRYIGTMATAVCDARNVEQVAGVISGEATATAILDPAKAIHCAGAVAATAVVGGTSEGYVEATLEATAYAQIGDSLIAVIEAFESRVSDVQISMTVIG